ncbi:MAG TPA: beta-ketoacyl-ACP synthase [Planctomycetota bacterium]|nr:beta-ketoacyl-ACP synthase [Planctomycetota bacterium]
MTSKNPCALEALGLVTALGPSALANLPRLIRGDGGLVSRTGLLPDRALLVGAATERLPKVPDTLAEHRCRNNQLALLALTEMRGALDDALRRFGPARIGVVAATSTSGTAETGEAVRQIRGGGERPADFHYSQFEHGGLARFIAASIGVLGPAYTVSTACSSSAKALVSARSLLRLGVCDAVIAGGVDSLCPLTACGFTALEAISPERSNPFSKNRRGLNLGEAAALFLLTRDEGGIQLRGAGESSDHHHMSAPDPTGAGAERAMRAALEDAGAKAGEILYLNLHGTGTPLNDAMESKAVERALGLAVPCSSTKPLTGHTLGAAGAVEAAFCWMMLSSERQGEIALAPHVFDGQRDEELPAIRLAAHGEKIRPRGRRLMMSNAFGFGGNNCTVILERGDA